MVEAKTMSVAWGNLEAHRNAFDEAKRRLGISSARDLSREQLREALALAEKIRQEQAQ